MIQKQIEIINKLGLHARAAAKFVTCASQFSSHIQVERNGRKVNGKSIMGVMMLAAARGTRLELCASGPEAAQALEELDDLVRRRFDEDE